MGKTELIKEVLALGDQVDHAIKHLVPEPWIDLKMTIAQLKSMFFIEARGKTHFKTLADALGVTPPNVTGIIDRLVEQDLVSRTESTEDRRIMILQLTEKGQELLNNLHQDRFRRMNKLMINMSEDDLKAMASAFKAMLKAVKAEPEIN